MNRVHKVTIYLSDDELKAIEWLRKSREKIPSLSAQIIELIWDGFPTDLKVRLRRERNGKRSDD